MSNERYLIVSYALVGLASLGLGWATYRFLRGPFAGTIERLAGNQLPRILHRLFAPGIVLAALAGFLSVSYRGCAGPTKYADIIANRAYLVQKNYEQVATSFEYLAYALLGWALLLTIALCLARRPASSPLPPRASEPASPNSPPKA